MTKKKYQKYLKNSLMFTAPLLALFFGQLATGVPLKQAFGVAILAMYANLADLFSKYKQ